MPASLTQTYKTRRGELETYFDRTAADAWAKLTSDAPVSGIRATVRAGRDAMRATLLSWLPADLTGRRVLDAGCGAGQVSVEMARRGAEVIGVDLSRSLLALAAERYADETLTGSLQFHDGDMFDPALGQFDHVLAMDSLIHYDNDDIVRVLQHFTQVSRKSVVFTVAPKTPLLGVMHTVGQFFPKSDRSPAIQPIATKRLQHRLQSDETLDGWTPARDQRIKSGFYISHAMELVARRAIDGDRDA